jgi:hypothetical protein
VIAWRSTRFVWQHVDPPEVDHPPMPGRKREAIAGGKPAE